ncbi:long-chain fatty acid--CoA ligase [Aneurinibacillus sp. Ricciae_BoGa-3]|uniref:long-chain-fatty-acid--CoA ligase n=1 Tax=Aneurinibacillus sp. Ricciae_BoGa-3 TaxID=3022697 RepID=UPI0023420ABE|nr:long-chain fatty acid--CoA ligase [Aneurinibacillus sp. Ricciae_BoGa-3]WCK52455.1 long-chain fatty acid--CoA ligase [Aneurinibacillus sp. Ricciae_BoGa-3]
MEKRPWHSFYPSSVPNKIEIPDISIYHFLERSAEDYPDYEAVVDGDRTLTYRELKTYTRRAAAHLHQLGFRKEDRIALILPNSMEYVIAYYTAQLLGGVVVQVNPMYQKSELAFMFEDSQARWLIGHYDVKQRIDSIPYCKNMAKIYVEGGSFIGEDGLGFSQLLAPIDRELTPTLVHPKKDIAVLQYTGGTTGRSKGAMLTHFNIVANVYQSYTTFNGVFKRPGERVLSISPFFHVYGMNNCMNLSIFGASTIICMRRFEVNHAIDLIKKYQPTFFPGVPTMYIGLLHHPEAAQAGLESIKVCNSGSAPMPVELMKEFEAKTGAVIMEGYGLSEASPVTHRNPIGGVRKPGTIGIPLPNTDSKIVDLDTGTIELEKGEPGELIVKGPQVMKGYWRRPEETASALRDGWLYTGDIATMDEDGYFTIVGRKKELIISGGYNIYPNEVEEILYQHPDVKEVCAFGVPDTYRGEAVKAAVVLREGAFLQEDQLISWCTAMMAKYKVPKSIEFLQQLPKTAVGKLLRRKLVEAEKPK